VLNTVGLLTSVKCLSGVLPVVCTANESPDNLAAMHNVTAAILHQTGMFEVTLKIRQPGCIILSNPQRDRGLNCGGIAGSVGRAFKSYLHVQGRK
jgi:hypothetical protein